MKQAIITGLAMGFGLAVGQIAASYITAKITSP